VIYTSTGKVARVLIDRKLLAGSVMVPWDGKDEAGNDMPKGMYIYQLKTGAEQHTGKLILN